MRGRGGPCRVVGDTTRWAALQPGTLPPGSAPLIAHSVAFEAIESPPRKRKAAELGRSQSGGAVDSDSETILLTSTAASTADVAARRAAESDTQRSCSESRHASDYEDDSELSEDEGGSYGATLVTEAGLNDRTTPNGARLPLSGLILRSVRRGAPGRPLVLQGNMAAAGIAPGPTVIAAANAMDSPLDSSLGAEATGAGQPCRTLCARRRDEVEVFAAPMHGVDESIRTGAEALLHEFWDRDDCAKNCISRLLEIQLKGMSLRSGRKTGRVDVSAAGAGTGVEKFLVWQVIREEEVVKKRAQRFEQPCRKVVGALILQRKRPAKRCPGGAVIEYVAVSRSRGGQGWPLVLAAEGICRGLGARVLYSAADLSQEGQFADVTASPSPPGCKYHRRSAMAAHYRWGFGESSKEEWKELGLHLYDDRRCAVEYMKKILDEGTEIGS